MGWFRGNYDAYFEAYEVDDEEFWRVLEEVSDDDPDRDLAYYVRERVGSCAGSSQAIQ